MAETDNTQQAPFAEQAVPPAPEVEPAEPCHPETSQDARNMAMLCHLLGIFGFFGPLLIWLIERDKHRFVNEHGREAMNYQISLLIYLTVLSITVIGLFLAPALIIAHVILSILGTLKASRGEPWHYPIALSFLR